MKKSEAEQAFSTLCDKWARETNQPWPPDGQHQYSFISFWGWLGDNHHPYTQFRAKPDARYVSEMWFDDYTKQAWRN
jgi:hypothetical protein